MAHRLCIGRAHAVPTVRVAVGASQGNRAARNGSACGRDARAPGWVLFLSLLLLEGAYADLSGRSTARSAEPSRVVGLRGSFIVAREDSGCDSQESGFHANSTDTLFHLSGGMINGQQGPRLRTITSGRAQGRYGGGRGGALRDSNWEMRSSCCSVRPISSQPFRRQRRRKGSTWKS